MKLSLKVIIFYCLLLPWLIATSIAQSAVTGLPSVFGKAGGYERVPVLVFFTDKGVSGKGELQAALDARRA